MPPRGLRLKLPAADLHRQRCANPEAAPGREEARAGVHGEPLQVHEWVGRYALAVHEEIAAGGCVITAPTDGAAGIVPAGRHHDTHFVPAASDKRVIDFLLTVAASGLLSMEIASISSAEVGGPGEVGVVCSVAAGALCAVLVALRPRSRRLPKSAGSSASV